jgi:hypothetical protein
MCLSFYLALLPKITRRFGIAKLGGGGVIGFYGLFCSVFFGLIGYLVVWSCYAIFFL